MRRFYKIGALGLLCLAAVVTGEWSEVFASPWIERYQSRGYGLDAYFVDFDSNYYSSDISVWSNSQVSVGNSSATTFATVGAAGFKLDFDPSFVYQAINAFASVDNSVLQVESSMNGGDLSATIPGTYIRFSADGFSEVPVDITIDIALIADSQTVHEASVYHRFDHQFGILQKSRVNAQTVFDTTGIGSITLSNGVEMVSPGTPTTFGYLRKHENSSFYLQP